jgi:hypothetical protein
MKNFKPGMLILFLMPFLLISCDKINDLLNTGKVPDDIMGMENVGCGYDVFDKYADVLSIKAAILDADLMNSAGILDFKKIEKGVFRTVSGTSIDEYTSSMSNTTNLSGSYKFFSGAVETNFSSGKYRYSEYSFATVQSLINKYGIRVGLNYTAEDLKQYLTTKARQDINNDQMAPATLFSMYGTHAVTGLVLGGRLDFSVSADMSKVTTTKGIRVFAEASFEATFASASVSNEYVSSEEMSQFRSTEEKRLEVYGGAAEYGQNIINDNDYQAWVSSIAANYVFCDFQEDGLMPIWDFCDSQTRRDALKAGFETWAADHSIETSTMPKNCILDLTVRTSSRWENLPETLEGGYVRIGADLNQGAGGDFVAIYALVGLDNSTQWVPINKIYIQNTSDGEGQEAGTTRDGTDLNKGAGGDYLYLCYTRGREHIVRAIDVFNQSSGSHQYSPRSLTTGQTWLWVMQQNNGNDRQDLNEDAGGDYIYLGYTYDKVN